MLSLHPDFRSSDANTYTANPDLSPAYFRVLWDVHQEYLVFKIELLVVSFKTTLLLAFHISKKKGNPTLGPKFQHHVCLFSFSTIYFP
jgi:hypothetical protein